MQVEIVKKPAFSVIGKLGSTADGPDFIGRLWAAANRDFPQIEHLVNRDERGVPVGFWGAMSDISGSFRPWEEDFSKGSYLAGAEVLDDAEPPEDWTKWRVPGFVYLKVSGPEENLFSLGLAYLREQGYTLAGAVQDFTDPKSGTNYQMFPIQKA